MLHPDARRIDVRATLRDPFETTFVRRSKPRVSIDLYALVDLSGSLRYEGRASKRDLVTQLCVALADSATRGGDRFGLVGCDAHVRDDCFLPASKRRGIAAEAAERLAEADFCGDDAEGLSTAAQRLVGARKMVFLISDFLLPLDLLRRTFEGLSQHDVVPVVIGDTSEDLELPDWGLLELADLETGQRGTVFMRPSLKARWLEADRIRRVAIRRFALEHGRTPVTIANQLDVDAFSRALLEA